jgi:mono/diheme cytochrome c family protein
MRRRLTWRYGQTALIVCACTMVLAVATRAQQAPAATLVPVAASSLLLHPELYLNQTVSVFGTVEQLLSATTFSMDQDAKKASMTDLLVVAPTLNAQPKAGTYMTVVGVVIRFDQAEIQKRAKAYTLDLAANVAERYRGQVMVLATSVVDPTSMIDLAKVLPKPMAPDEEALSKVMKQVNPAAAELRKGADASDKAIVTAQAAALGKLLGETQKVFEARAMPDAVGWATEGVALMASIEKAAAASQWPEVQASATKLTTLCQACHGARRERLDDGTYRIKK